MESEPIGAGSLASHDGQPTFFSKLTYLDEDGLLTLSAKRPRRHALRLTMTLQYNGSLMSGPGAGVGMGYTRSFLVISHDV